MLFYYVGIACVLEVVPYVVQMWEPNLGAKIFHTQYPYWVRFSFH
jgi:hypothetical protein